MNRKFKDRGFTDQLYWLNFRCVWGFVTLCYIMTLFSGYLGITDLSIVSYGIPAAFTELGLHTGYIIWKAKNENINKHSTSDIPEQGLDDGCDDYYDSEVDDYGETQI